MMKKPAYILLFMIISYGCNEQDFLDRTPTGVLNPKVLSTEKGIQSLLTGAYAALDGNLGGIFIPFSTPSNWLWGEVTSDNAHRGSIPGDQPAVTDVERFKVPAVGFEPTEAKWVTAYEGVTRANDVLRIVKVARSEGVVSKEKLIQFEAEARFLRGHYHFEVKKVFDRVPFLPEDTEDVRISNEQSVWPEIEADFQFAVDHLPDEQIQRGRPNRWGAIAYLAKAHLYQQDYATAKPCLDEVIANGPYTLLANYNENFDGDFDNNPESVFSVQYSVNDGAPGDNNGNLGEIINYPGGSSPYGCCGFFQPTQNLVNAFQTNPVTGLPLIGFQGAADTFNEEPGVRSDQGVSSSAPFTEHPGTLDPRLDWTVGRRGIPYQGFGDHPGKNWIRDQSFSGPYSPRKNVWKAEDRGGTVNTEGGWAGVSSMNTVLIRYAQVLLWRAEIAVEEGDLATAMDIVNRIRRRARDGHPVVEDDGGTPAANYFIHEYPPSHPVFFNPEDARKAVHFETRLELAMEGHRFFDLVRWGEAAEVINKYLEVEQTRRPALLGNVTFRKGVHERMPIPQREIDLTIKDGERTLHQNNGY